MKATNQHYSKLLAHVLAYIDKEYIADSFFYRINRSMKIDTLDLPTVEPFSTYLFEIIDQKGLDDVSVYKKAMIDRKLFSKMRTNKDYQPSKKTVFKLALALECSLKESKEMLEYAGYAFSKASKFDLIVEYALNEQIYDIITVNILLDELINESL